MAKEPTTWGGNNQSILWNDNIFTWNDVFILREVEESFSTGGSGGFILPKKPIPEIEKKLGKEKAEKFVRVVCKFNDIEYDNTKKVKDQKITVQHIVKTFAALNVNVEISSKENHCLSEMIMLRMKSSLKKRFNLLKL